MAVPNEIKLIEENLNAGHFKLNLDNNSFRCSEVFLKIVEASSNNPLEWDEWISLFNKSDHEHIIKCFEQAKNGKAVETELILSLEGDQKKYITLNFNPIFEEKGDITNVFGVIQDKAHQTKDREALKQSQRTLEHITDTVPGVVYRLKITPDKKQSFEFISSGCKQLLGVESEAILQNFNLVWDLIHPEDQKKIHSTIERVELATFWWTPS